MSQFQASKLHTTFLPSANETLPVSGRKYTLTHSDTTGHLFLTVGPYYNLTAIHVHMRDEVLAEWTRQQDQFTFVAHVYVSGGEFDEQAAKKRFMIFQREAPLALTAIFYGDRAFFSNYPQLLDSPIYLYFESTYSPFHQVLYYGTPRNYIQPE
ncbi:staygreen family protein [Neobacillus sp. MM2021_6]|nr:staygreen family protein [Neobacillus sp. MM2021_6]NHC18849.1 hypothetical protein [Bacillus sp. MM2020_4]